MALHVVGALALVQALLLRLQALALSFQNLVFGTDKDLRDSFYQFVTSTTVILLTHDRPAPRFCFRRRTRGLSLN
jgi:hypothetical protein